MIHHIWKPALALGAVLALSGAASADDRDTRLLGGTTGATMTLGGQGTVAQAATEDLELTGHYGYRGYYGWGGGARYGGYYGGYRGGYRGGYGGYYGGYRGGYGGYGGYRGYYGGFARPYYAGYYGGFARPYYGGYYAQPYYGLSYSSYSYYQPFPVYSTYYCGPSLYLGIGGDVGSGAPTVTLGGTDFATPSPVVTQPMTPPAAPADGTFPYDGGPMSPVPLPKADPNAAPPINVAPTATDLPISLKPKTATTPYKYKAYGEK